MRPVLVSWSDLHGGAARAAYRLHRALREINVDSRMVVAAKVSDDDAVIGPSALGRFGARISARLDRLPLRRYRNAHGSLFSPAWAPGSAAARVRAQQGDLVHVHWVNNGCLRIESLARLTGPLLWTLHDQWLFTGGCHYSGACTRYLQSCGACPTLGSNNSKDLSRAVFLRKQQAWPALPLTLITPSRWLAQLAATSALARGRRIEVIPNCLDTDVFKPSGVLAARRELKLPEDGYVVLFSGLLSARDERKGYQLLAPALERLSKKLGNGSICLVVLGMNPPANPAAVPYVVRYLGVLSDDSQLARAYAAADVFVAPSLQDNLPNTVMEALSCGTPCVAFDVGGMPDLIEHRDTGYLARAYEVEDLAAGLEWVCSDRNRQRALSARAREKVLTAYSPKIIAERHMALYEDVLSSARRNQRVA
jgi:glycosyltransferase involved in cell wall biosynthesis